jgi:hypothetical protein
MKLLKFQILILYAFLSVFAPVTPLWAGYDDDNDSNCDDQSCDMDDVLIPVPMVFPIFDAYRGRSIIQMPAPAVILDPICKAVSQQIVEQGGKVDQGPMHIIEMAHIENDDTSDSSSDSDDENVFRHETDKPRKDKSHNRKSIRMAHGSPSNPCHVSDHGLVQGGIVAKISVIEPHSGTKASLRSKWTYTRNNWANRYAENNSDARNMKWGKTPRKAADFDSWEIGDWIRKGGIAGAGLYLGAGWLVGLNGRAGVELSGTWTRQIQKIAENVIRVTLTRETKGGPIARARAGIVRSQVNRVINHETTRDYLFDLDIKEERKALERLLNKNILPAKNLAEKLSEDDKATKLTTKHIIGNRSTNTPFQIGIPLIYRYRIAKHIDRPVTTTIDHRTGKESTVSVKAYLHQRTHLHINRPGHENRKWKYFPYTNQHYNKTYAGSVVIKTDPKDKDHSDIARYLRVQITYSHDNVKVKAANEYSDKIAAAVGINDHIIDLGYKTHARIGHLQIHYTLDVPNEQLEELIIKNAKNELLIQPALDAIDDYFYVQNDPHNMCEHHSNTQREKCIEKIRLETNSAAIYVGNRLLALNKKQVRKSVALSTKYLAKISRGLATNQFILQSFLKALPAYDAGYAKLEIYGEQVLAKRLQIEQGMLDLAEASEDDLAYTPNFQRFNDEQFGL